MRERDTTIQRLKIELRAAKQAQKAARAELGAGAVPLPLALGGAALLAGLVWMFATRGR